MPHVTPIFFVLQVYARQNVKCSIFQNAFPLQFPTFLAKLEAYLAPKYVYPRNRRVSKLLTLVCNCAFPPCGKLGRSSNNCQLSWVFHRLKLFQVDARFPREMNESCQTYIRPTAVADWNIKSRVLVSRSNSSSHKIWLFESDFSNFKKEYAGWGMTRSELKFTTNEKLINFQWLNFNIPKMVTFMMGFKVGKKQKRRQKPFKLASNGLKNESIQICMLLEN